MDRWLSLGRGPLASVRVKLAAAQVRVCVCVRGATFGRCAACGRGHTNTTLQRQEGEKITTELSADDEAAKLSMDTTRRGELFTLAGRRTETSRRRKSDSASYRSIGRPVDAPPD